MGAPTKICASRHIGWRAGARVAPMRRLSSESGKFEAFDVILILLMVFLLFGISLQIA
jgi:hypothetical protein